MVQPYKLHSCDTLTYIIGGIEETTSASGQKNKKFTFSKGPPVDRLCSHCNHPFHIGKLSLDGAYNYEGLPIIVTITKLLYSTTYLM